MKLTLSYIELSDLLLRAGLIQKGYEVTRTKTNKRKEIIIETDIKVD